MADATPAPAPKKLTKKELRILERQKAAAASAGPTLTDTYGELPLIQSKERPNHAYKSYVTAVFALIILRSGSDVDLRVS